jgi:hypothetical protein
MPSEINETMIQWAGNWLLTLMAASYLCTWALLVIIWPRDRLDWSNFTKIGSIALVLVNAAAIVHFQWGHGLLFRMIVFALATLACWWFTIESWLYWRRHGGRFANSPLVMMLCSRWEQCRAWLRRN